MEKRYNQRSPAVRRLMREAIELKDPTQLYSAQPLEDNLFEWHFTIRGPPGTDFDGGVYHGRIILPPEYPMKPPSIVMLTPNGRFELNQKICLSASSYHPELWQASWGIRTMLLALIGFMPSDGLGTIGSLDCSSEARQHLARRSSEWMCPICGIANNDLLPEHEKGERDKEVEKEMKEIVSQMAIKSPDEIDSEYNKLMSSQKGTSNDKVTHKSHDVVSRDKEGSHDEGSHDTIQTDNSGIRQRVHAQPVAPPTTDSHTANNQHSSSNRSFILVIIILLLIAIVGLIARRIF